MGEGGGGVKLCGLLVARSVFQFLDPECSSVFGPELFLVAAGGSCVCSMQKALEKG